MDTKFRSSFIPKASYSAAGEANGESKLFSFVAVIVFVIGVVATAGLFGYKIFLKRNISNLESQLSSAAAAVDKEGIEEIILFDRKLKLVNKILSQHVLPTNFFKMLEESTVSQVKFSDLRLEAARDGNVTFQINGQARSFAAVALQEDVFLKNPSAVTFSFGDLRSDEKTGTVSFSLKGELKGNILNYDSPEPILVPIDESLSTIEEKGAAQELGTLPDFEEQ